MAAWSALLDYRLTYPLDELAQDLYDKYSRLERDWAAEVQSVGEGA